MIAQNQRVNGEFYVAPVYNACIEQGARIGIWNIGTETNGMYGLGTPADLDLFLSLPDLTTRRGNFLMIIISHRGYWIQPAEKNTEEAFSRSFERGMGTETDVRDHRGELVISHDMPCRK